jgi:hypothetical protein
MRSLTKILLTIFFVCIVHSKREPTSSPTTSSQSLEERLAALESRLDDREGGEILWFTNRKTCPEGYYPMESASGRLVVVDTFQRGRITEHTLESKREIPVACGQTFGVSENGANQVCGNSPSGGMSVSTDLNEMFPTVKMMACSRNNGPDPRVP